MPNPIKILLIALCLSLSQHALSQSRRISIDIEGGVPVPIASIPGSLSTYGGIGIRYNLTKEISIQAIGELGTMRGTQNVSKPREITDVPADYLNFTNNFFQYSGNLHFNLERIFGLRPKLNRLNPYFFMGAGWINSNVSALRVDGSRAREYSHVNIYNGYGGFSIRYYLNPEIDILVSTTFHFTESGFIDGVPTDNSFDQYFMNSIGISYKIGARSDKQHIEWNNVIVKTRVLIPDLERRHGQPVDEDGNFILFNKDSIDKIVAATKKLQLENKQQQEEINRINETVDAMQQQVDELRLLVNQLKKNPVDSTKKAPTLAKQPVAVVQTPSRPSESGQGAPSATSGQNIAVAPKQSYVPGSGILAPTPVPPVPSGGPAGKGKTKQAAKPTVPPGQVTDPKQEPVVAANPPSAANKSSVSSTPKQPASSTVQPAVPSASSTVTLKSKPEKIKEPFVQTPAEPTVYDASDLNSIDDIVPPPHKYNVIVGAYQVKKYAFIFRDRLRTKGYSAAIFRSRPSSRMLRVAVLSTDDRQEALRQARKARKEIDAGAWIHIYNAPPLP